MRALAFVCLLTCLLLCRPATGEAAIYKYTDESGRTVFVDSESRIPARYRNSSGQVMQAPPPPAAEQQAEAGAENPGERRDAGETVEPEGRAIVDRALEQRARQEAAELERARAYQTPVVVQGNRVLIPAEVIAGTGTAHLMLLLDDKAPATIFYRNAVQQLRFAPGEKVTLPVAGNRPISGEKVVVGVIDIGPFELRDFPAVLITPQGGVRTFDGILGMDFLKDHPYTVDYPRELLKWQLPGR